MPNKFLIQEIDGTPPQITFADFAGDYSPAAANDKRHASATDTEVQLTFAAVVDGAYRQSAKFDFGEHRAAAYVARGALEFEDGIAVGDIVEVRLAPSQHATAANGNPGGVSGADSAYTGYNANPDDAFLQMDLIGIFSCTGDATGTVQQAEIGVFSPTERYGTLVYKITGDNFHSDDVEMSIVFDPIIDELQ